jgi:voltage-gated potassium channel Kch
VWLGLVALAIVVTAGIALQVLGIEIEPGRRAGFVEGVWLSLQRTLDAGTGGGDQGWSFRAVSLFVTLGGIFVVTALIGLTANGIDRKLAQLSRGRTLVVEEGHTLVLGWSTKLPTILQELAIANANQRRAAVVILAEIDKLEMDHAVRQWMPRDSRTRVVTRTGRPYSAADLALVGPDTARSVIVLAAEDDPEGAYTLKTVLALLAADVPPSAPLVVEVHDSRRAGALRTATSGRVLPVVSSEIIARITAQVCRQSGLSMVYQELLDFDGDEIYFGADPRLAGRRFGDVLLAYPSSAVIGIRTASGETNLVPGMDTVLADGDQVVAVSRDDDTVVLGELDRPAGGAAVTPSARAAHPDHVLVVGWNHMGPHLIRELDAYAVEGSSVTVLCDESFGDAPAQVACGHLTVHVVHGDTTDEDLLAKTVTDRWPDHAVLLCYHGQPVAESDARTLLTLLELRHIFEAGDGPEPTVVAELLDVEDVALAPVTAADDFVVSEKLTSYVLAQLSENPSLAPVFDELLSAGGCEILIRPAADYLPYGEIAFGDIVAGFRSLGDVVIGYRQRQPGASAGATTVLNAAKSSSLVIDAHTEVISLTRP